MLRPLFEKIIKGEKLSDAERAYFLDWADKAMVLVAPPAQSVTIIEQNITPLRSVIQEEIENLVRGRNWIQSVSQISNQLGLQIAGEFRTGNGRAPGDGFTGGRFGWPGFTYNSIEWFLAGVANDVLKTGLNISNGLLYAENAEISGTLTATAGNIGGWLLDESSLSSLSSNIGIVLNSQDVVIAVGNLAGTYIRIDGANQYIRSSNFVAGAAGFNISSATGDAEFNNLTARGELKTFLLTSSNQMAVAGNIIVSKDAGKLGADVSSGATTVNFGKALTVGNWIKIQGPDDAGSNNLEWMLIGSLVSGTTYNVTRNVDGSGANGWLKDTPFVVIGASGDSRIELVAGASGSIQLITQGATWNTQTVQASMSTTAGAITAGAGGILMNSDGIVFGNTSGVLFFKDSTGVYDATHGVAIFGQSDDSLAIVNRKAGKALEFIIKLTDASTPYLAWYQDPNVANVPLLQINAASTTPAEVSIGGPGDGFANGILLWANKDGKETVFNDTSYDIDFRIESATNANFFKIDAGGEFLTVSDIFRVDDPEDRVEIGADHYFPTRNSSDTTTYFNEANQDMDTKIRTTNSDDALVMDAGLDKATSFLWDGWGLRHETWTRTGNHTFTISGDFTTVFRKGAKVRYKDGGSYEYGTVASSSVAAGTTTVNLIVNSDYAMAAATITDRYVSYIDNPEGFPSYFAYASTVSGTGGSAGAYAETNRMSIFSVRGTSVHVHVEKQITALGSWTGNLQMLIPVAGGAAYSGGIHYHPSLWANAAAPNAPKAFIAIYNTTTSAFLDALNSSFYTFAEMAANDTIVVHAIYEM